MMKKFNNYVTIIAMVGLLFTSCSKEDENSSGNSDSEKATLSFGAVLNDLVTNRSSSKQAIENLPACSEDDPAYVEIILLEGDDDVVGSTDDPFRIDLVSGQEFTEEVPELELEPGTYTLDHFAVYNAGGDLIWLAPRGGVLAEFIDNPLPLSIDLGAGVKKYVDVPVLCFDNRDVNEYGYLFFEFNEQRAIEFCVFGNYCDGTGRHFPAHFRVEVWTFSGNNNSPKGTALFDDEDPYINVVGVNDEGDQFAEPLCFPLPDTPGVDRYYGEIYLLEFGDEDDEGTLVTSGVFTDANVRSLYTDGDSMDYYHFREDCELGDSGF